MHGWVSEAWPLDGFLAIEWVTEAWPLGGSLDDF